MTTLELLEGDCLQLMAALPERSVDCFICDLPYGCLAGPKADSPCAWDVPINLKDFWVQVKRLAKHDHVPVIMFCTTKFGVELIQSNPSWFRYDLVWDKMRGVSFLSANKMPMRSHEMIYIFSKSGAQYQRIDVKGDFKKWAVNRDTQTAHCYGEAKKTSTEGGDGHRCVKSIIQVSGHLSRSKGQHPTEKPIELYKWLIERYCPEGGTILDPTAGSFNSCFAAFELGRNSIGIEMNHPYFEKACKRVDTLNTV
jgi:DNA modification methylase